MEDLTCLVSVLERGSGIAWYYGCVVEKVKDTAAMAREEDLLLGALDDGGEVDVVGLFQLLTSLLFFVNDLAFPHSECAGLRCW